MRELSLFTGVGGGLLGTKLLGFTHVGYVENNEYCQRVLRQRINDGILDDAPIFGDIRAFLDQGYAESYQGMVDVVTAGFPCQPYSTAASGKNITDTVWKYALEAIKRIQPRFVFCENVSRHAISKAADGLHELSYHTKEAKVSAADLGADHIRSRYWLLAYTDNESQLLSSDNAEMGVMPKLRAGVWETFTFESRMVNGSSNRMERYRALGNGQVPIVVATAFRLLTEELT